MRTRLVMTVALLTAVVGTLVGCGALHVKERTEDYRTQEAVAAVHAYLFDLAEGDAATQYVYRLIWGQYGDQDNYQWRARYGGTEDSDKWTVEMYYSQSSGGLVIVSAWWNVYGEDMGIIDCHEHDAMRIKGIIEELNVG